MKKEYETPIVEITSFDEDVNLGSSTLVKWTFDTKKGDNNEENN